MNYTGTVHSTSTGIEIWRWILKEPARARIRLLYCARIRVAAHGGFFRSARWRNKVPVRGFCSTSAVQLQVQRRDLQDSKINWATRIRLCAIFEHKKDIAEQVIREKGFKPKKECHGGARKRTKSQILAKRAPGCTVPAVDSDFE